MGLIGASLVVLIVIGFLVLPVMLNMCRKKEPLSTLDKEMLDPEFKAKFEEEEE